MPLRLADPRPRARRRRSSAGPPRLRRRAALQLGRGPRSATKVHRVSATATSTEHTVNLASRIAGHARAGELLVAAAGRPRRRAPPSSSRTPDRRASRASPIPSPCCGSVSVETAQDPTSTESDGQAVGYGVTRRCASARSFGSSAGPRANARLEVRATRVSLALGDFDRATMEDDSCVGRAVRGG